MFRKNMIQVLKAFYRYFLVIIRRNSENNVKTVFVMAKRDYKINKIAPNEEVNHKFFRKIPTVFEFYTKWAPWILANRKSEVLVVEHNLPNFIRKFCLRFNIPLKLEKSRIYVSEPNKDRGRVAEIPFWFQSAPTHTFSEKIKTGRPLFLYLPWIQEHGDKLIGRIEGGDAYQFAEFDIFKNIEDAGTRRAIGRFAREQPDVYRRMVLRRLVPIRSRISGFVFTFDWAPVARIIAGACHELGIPTFLIPHESVFLDRTKYYWDPTGNASVPVCDVILGWGRLQKEIFGERGYDVSRFVSVGAPKFDAYHNYRPELSREQYHRIFGLNPDRKTILFATQPLDSQTDAKAARQSQRQAIRDLLDYSERNDYQVLVRLPPSKDDILGAALKERIKIGAHASLDDAHCYIVSAEEAIHHCDLVASINSTMLFEGLLAGKPAIAIRYVDFVPFWTQAGIPAVNSVDELNETLDLLFRREWKTSEEGMQWAADLFGVGEFDGLAADRIQRFLKGFVTGDLNVQVTPLPSAVERLFGKQPLDVVAIASTKATMAGIQRFLPQLLNARRVESSRDAKLSQLVSADIFFQWGITPNNAKRVQKMVANDLGKPTIIVEDGFLRSIDIGLSGEPGLSIILDDTTAYYDATKRSRLERLLESGPELSAEEVARARAAIRKIVDARVSKYNSAPQISLEVGNKERKKVLLVDQRFGDQSITSGLANDESFEKALLAAVKEHPDSDILVKQHPDATRGGKSSYFSDERLANFQHLGRIYPIKLDINPYSLFDLVEDVYVVTSGMGFEGLLAGKRVHCFGMPFYAGWGLTNDAFSLEGRRTRTRSLEEVFHYAYIDSSRYFNPDKNSLVEIEDIIDYLAEKRDLFLRENTSNSHSLLESIK